MPCIYHDTAADSSTPIELYLALCAGDEYDAMQAERITCEGDLPDGVEGWNIDEDGNTYYQSGK